MKEVVGYEGNTPIYKQAEAVVVHSKGFSHRDRTHRITEQARIIEKLETVAKPDAYLKQVIKNNTPSRNSIKSVDNTTTKKGGRMAVSSWDINKDKELIKLYLEGVSGDDMSEQLSVAKSRLYSRLQQLRKAGVKIPSGRSSVTPKTVNELNDLLKELGTEV